MNFERDLILSASREAWKMSSLHGTQSAAEYKRKHKDTWDKVWQRDKYRCYYCSFTAKEHQEIHHLNDNHDDNSMDNLVTVCPLCHQNFHLDTASNTNGGKIIWLPEFSQQELNYLCRAIFIAIDEASSAEAEQREVPGFTKIARNLETSLEERTMIVDQRIYSGASDPAVFANALINMSKEQYDNRHKFLQPFKLLHLRSRFPTQTKYWKSKVFENIPVETWSRLILNNSNNNE